MPDIKAATVEDAEGINAVSAHLGYTPLSPSDARDALTQLLDTGHDRVYIALQDRHIVGWIHLFLARRVASPAFFEIGGLVVDPAFRRRGIARALVDHATAQADKPVRVRCRDDRSETHRFYLSLGFKTSKTQRVFTRSSD
ncbi:MAG: GNAT family N-acetyltransferase [Pseudomonadota bacterium]